MGLGKAIATAAAVTPIVRDYFHRHEHHRSRSDSSDGTIIPPRPSSSRPSPPSESRDSEEMARRPLLAVDAQVPVPSRQSSAHSTQGNGYGTILPEGPPTLRASPERYRRDSLLDRVPEETALDEEDEELEAQEWDLAQQGFYSGE